MALLKRPGIDVSGETRSSLHWRDPEAASRERLAIGFNGEIRNWVRCRDQEALQLKDELRREETTPYCLSLHSDRQSVTCHVTSKMELLTELAMWRSNQGR
ncbi:hypothetical protein RRG08_009571 [Elysia crispata]|uniref:Uncharacterized protein n=1 Tax=Elysia crispata TaxID=231223 RepID=A0AAE1CEY7_9GAST|nr:hypothetical protein RRG08_009571 [Elysia crispata]